MKFYLRHIFIFLVLCSLSCKKEKKKGSEITMDYPLISGYTMEVALDTVNVDSFIYRESIDFPTNLDDQLAKNNTSKSLIKSAVLESLRLQILDYAYAETYHCYNYGWNTVCDSNHYSNFQDISMIYLDIKKDGIGQELIAKKELNPDKRTNIISLDVVGAELKKYLQQESFRMVFKFKKRRQMHHQMPFTIIGKFKIVADPLN